MTRECHPPRIDARGATWHADQMTRDGEGRQLNERDSAPTTPLTEQERRAWLQGVAEGQHDLMSDDQIRDIGIPNCETCLSPMDISGIDEKPFWACQTCGVTRIT